jgi:hypothetical protein
VSVVLLIWIWNIALTNRSENHSLRKDCSAQDLADSGNFSPAKSANGLGTWGISYKVLIVLLLYDERS